MKDCPGKTFKIGKDDCQPFFLHLHDDGEVVFAMDGAVLVINDESPDEEVEVASLLMLAAVISGGTKVEYSEMVTACADVSSAVN
jgi:hypothetical protein